MKSSQGIEISYQLTRSFYEYARIWGSSSNFNSVLACTCTISWLVEVSKVDSYTCGSTTKIETSAYTSNKSDKHPLLVNPYFTLLLKSVNLSPWHENIETNRPFIHHERINLNHNGDILPRVAFTTKLYFSQC